MASRRRRGGRSRLAHDLYSGKTVLIVEDEPELPELRADPRTRSIPVVVVSAYASSLLRTPHGRDVLEKPIDLWQLLDLVHGIVEAA